MGQESRQTHLMRVSEQLISSTPLHTHSVRTPVATLLRSLSTNVIVASLPNWAPVSTSAVPPRTGPCKGVMLMMRGGCTSCKKSKSTPATPAWPATVMVMRPAAQRGRVYAWGREHRSQTTHREALCKQQRQQRRVTQPHLNTHPCHTAIWRKWRRRSPKRTPCHGS